MERYTRTCKKCKQKLNITQFARAGIKNGKMYYRHVCKICHSKNQKPRQDKIRKWLREYKKKQKCLICGTQDHRVLVFHHIEHKSFNIADAIRYGIKKTIEEIKKCIVLCANCHQIEHYT